MEKREGGESVPWGFSTKCGAVKPAPLKISPRERSRRGPEDLQVI